MKKIISLLCATLMTISLCACQQGPVEVVSEMEWVENGQQTNVDSSLLEDSNTDANNSVNSNTNENNSTNINNNGASNVNSAINSNTNSGSVNSNTNSSTIVNSNSNSGVNSNVSINANSNVNSNVGTTNGKVDANTNSSIGSNTNSNNKPNSNSGANSNASNGTNSNANSSVNVNDNANNNTNSNTNANTGNNSGAASSNTTNTNLNTKINNPLAVDLKGATINIYDISTFNIDPSVSKTTKAKYDMINKIQSELNCKFKVTTTTDEKMETFVTTSAASGKALCGIISPSMYNSGYYISANLVTNLTKVSSMDLSKDYMNRYNILNASQFGSAKYAVAAEGESRTYVVFYNKRILEELGYTENYIYDLVDSGKWTYDEYRNLAKKAMKELDGKPGMSAADQWGMVTQDGSTGLPSNIIVSFGTSMIKLSSNGMLKYNMTDSKITNSINLSYDILVKDGTDGSANGSTVDERVDIFANGKALFLFASVHKAADFSSMKDEFGLVPVPQATANKNYSSAIDWNARVLMMPAGLSAEDQYNAGAVIQAYQYLYDDVLDVMEKEYVNRYLCDDKSGDNFRIAAKGMTTMPEYLYSQTNETILSGTYRIFWDYCNGKSNSPSSNIEAQKSAVEKSLEELNTKIKDK